MEELKKKLNELKNELDKDERVKKIKELNKKINNDKELLDLLDRYHKGEINLKDKILKNELFREYKEEETELNILILEINKKKKKIKKGKGHCQI